MIRLSCFEILLPCLNLNNIVRFVPATCSCGASVAQLVEKMDCHGFESS